MGDEKELKTFDVTVTVDYKLMVEAEDSEQAEEMAHDLWYSEGDICDVSVSYMSEV